MYAMTIQKKGILNHNVLMINLNSAYVVCLTEVDDSFFTDVVEQITEKKWISKIDLFQTSALICLTAPPALFSLQRVQSSHKFITSLLFTWRYII